MKKRVAVVIPYYHKNLSELERISFRNCLDILRKHPIILVVPESMPLEHHPQYQDVIYEKVPNAWLESVASYNQMMLSREFYVRFTEYEYILIFQLDAFVFSDCLNKFCDYGYDYIGAPWINGLKYLKDLERGVWYVGNGGLSLRRIPAFLELLDSGAADLVEIHEDVFWSSCSSKKFHVAPFDIALQFAFEKDVRQCYQRNQYKLPFGCHAWEKYDFDFWRLIFEEKGYHPKIERSKGEDQENNGQVKNYGYLKAQEGTVRLCLNRLFHGENRKLYVFGAGIRGEECCWLLRHNHISDIGCVDNCSHHWGKRIWGVPIESPKILESADRDGVFIIITVKYLKDEILDQLIKMGYRYKEIFCYDELTDNINAEISDDIRN